LEANEMRIDPKTYPQRQREDVAALNAECAAMLEAMELAMESDDLALIVSIKAANDRRHETIVALIAKLEAGDAQAAAERASQRLSRRALHGFGQ